jgi:tRNA(Ile)-lysidine synthase
MHQLNPFLQAHLDAEKPLLLGYSGGPDSKALLYALLEYGVKHLHLAHIDHGWRPESAQEAEQLREEARLLGCPFHSIRLDRMEGGNQEDKGRKERLFFFSSLCSCVPYQALLLAHQADDLAETALKRILEGAHLPFLGGMEPVSRQGDLVIWRPLLGVRKQEIEDYLKKKNLVAIRDATNFDPAYLRARMRLEILPLLSEKFGKNITSNLILLAERASELKHFLDEQIASIPIHRESWGLAADLKGLSRILKRHFLQALAKEEAFSFPRSLLESLLDGLEAEAPYLKYIVQSRQIYADRGAVFLFARDHEESLSGVKNHFKNYFLLRSKIL